MLTRNRLFGDDMALEHIATLLKQITDELKKHNERMDEKYGRIDVLQPSDARTTRDGSCCGKCENEKGECK